MQLRESKRGQQIVGADPRQLSQIWLSRRR
jgi:hypothetical protein